MGREVWKKQLGRNIGLYRKKRGLTQEQAAELYDCSLRAWQRWERGVNMEIVSLIKIARIVAVKPSKLLE